jgi:hypothetical protein
MPINAKNTNTAAASAADANNIGEDIVVLTLSMSCETFWDYETELHLDRKQFSRKYINRPEEEAFQKLSQFLCLHMKKHIEDELIDDGKRDMLAKLEEVFPKFHIHGQTSHEILYPNDPSNSDHCRGDGKIFICTHC